MERLADGDEGIGDEGAKSGQVGNGRPVQPGESCRNEISSINGVRQEDSE